MISNDTYITGYDAPCPKCGHVMIEPLARLPARGGGTESSWLSAPSTVYFTSGQLQMPSSFLESLAKSRETHRACAEREVSE